MGSSALAKSAAGTTFVKQYVWKNIIFLTYAHLGALYGLYLFLTATSQAQILYITSLIFISGMGITAGAHRLWAHRTYKANWGVRFMLCLFQTTAFQNHIYEWVRDHRAHHKFSETDADPHNARRGFFFCHMGWLMVKKHPDVITKGRTIDLSDLEQDPIVVWQRRYYVILMPLLAFVFPTWSQVYFFGTDPWTAWYITLFRWILIVNGTWCVNSVAHFWGNKPYDRNINPTESVFVAIVAAGEGWHNYHHTFPYDYKAAELGNYSLNITTSFIDLLAYLGWVSDRRTVPPEVVMARVKRTGDGSHSAQKVTGL